MNFDSFSDFLAMGGHGLYVWLAYAAGVMVVAVNVFSVRAARRRYFRQARSLARRLQATGGGTGGATGNPIRMNNEDGN